MIDDMMRAWRDGDIVAAEKLFLGSMTEFPEIQEKLLDERNRNWLPQIEKFIGSGEDTLVVVGRPTWSARTVSSSYSNHAV